jgi:hypothetical protein
MDSKQIHDSKAFYSYSTDGCLSSTAVWLKEIAYQLAVLNERQASVLMAAEERNHLRLRSGQMYEGNKR